MRSSIYLLPVLLLVLVGCGPKASNEPPSTATAASSLKDRIVGDWTLSSAHGNTKVDGTITIRADGTFTNAGTVASEKKNDYELVKMTLSYSVSGKWTLDGDTVASKPDAVTAHVDNLDVTLKDPSNQPDVDKRKAAMAKKAEDQAKASLSAPSKSRVESATADELTLVGAKGAKAVYTRKK